MIWALLVLIQNDKIFIYNYNNKYTYLFFKNYSKKIIPFFKRLLTNPMIRALAFRGLWRVLRLLIFRR